MNKYGVAILAGAILLGACQAPKKPTRRNVVITNPKRYGPAWVDTFGGKAPAVITKPAATETKPTVDVSAKSKEAITKATPLWQKMVAFSTFKGKAKMQFKGLGQSHEFTANIRMKKDEAIWINVSIAGGLVNVARIYVTPDSFQLVNFLQKEAMRMPIEQAVRVLPAKVDFSILQNLMVGNALITKGKPINGNEQGGTLSMQVESDDIIQELTYNKADNNMRSLAMRTKDNRTEGMIQYANYGQVSGINFAGSRAINLNNAGEPYYISMSFNDAEFNVPVDMPFSIPKNHKVK
jgi:hypothetical protein